MCFQRRLVELASYTGSRTYSVVLYDIEAQTLVSTRQRLSRRNVVDLNNDRNTQLTWLLNQGRGFSERRSFVHMQMTSKRNLGCSQDDSGSGRGLRRLARGKSGLSSVDVASLKGVHRKVREILIAKVCTSHSLLYFPECLYPRQHHHCNDDERRR